MQTTISCQKIQRTYVTFLLKTMLNRMEENIGRHIHRRVLEESLGRKLDCNEVVHHIDGNKKNNNLPNLVLMSRSEHVLIHGFGKKTKGGDA